MGEKQLIVAIEGTAAMGPFWWTVLTEYLEKIIRAFCANDLAGQKPPSSNAQLSFVVFNAHGSYTDCLVSLGEWTRDVDTFLQQLREISFSSGDFSDAAIAEGLYLALLMFLDAPTGSLAQQNLDGQRHCILVAASNPHPFIYVARIQNSEHSKNVETQIERCAYDVETIAKSFIQWSVSLSVICPKQLPKLRAIYNAGKGNTRAVDPPVDDVKNPHWLVLIPESFMEARSALSCPGVPNLPPNQSPVKMNVSSTTAVTGPPPTSIPSVNGSILNRPLPISNENIPTATVNVMTSSQNKNKGESREENDIGRVRWTKQTRISFCNLCKQDIQSRTGKCGVLSRRIQWEKVKEKFNNANNLQWDKTKLKNKFDWMKTRWSLWKQLTGKETGLEWNYDKETIVASEEWSMLKIKENNNFKKFKKEGLEPELERLLDELFGCLAREKITFCHMTDPLQKQREVEEVYVPSSPNSHNVHQLLSNHDHENINETSHLNNCQMIDDCEEVRRLLSLSPIAIPQDSHDEGNKRKRCKKVLANESSQSNKSVRTDSTKRAGRFEAIYKRLDNMMRLIQEMNTSITKI